MPGMRIVAASMSCAFAVASSMGDVQCKQGDTCASHGLTLLQTNRESQQKALVDSEVLSGLLTMWSDSPTTIVGGSCEYANAALGGLAAPSATSPYVASRAYCAADDALYQAGATCGACFRVSYDGSPATDPGRAGSMVIQIVDSGSAKTFDCQVDAFEAITGSRTGVFPVTYEPVACEAEGGIVATVLDGNNAWYTKVIFSNLQGAVASAKIVIAGKDFPMTRVSGATWSASPGGLEGTASFVLTLEDGSVVDMSSCFELWPVATGTSCTKRSSAAPTPATTIEATAPPTMSPMPATTQPSSEPETCADLCSMSPSSGTCSAHTDESSCANYYFKQGTHAVPCSWTSCGGCVADGAKLLDCPNLESQCGTA